MAASITIPGGAGQLPIGPKGSGGAPTGQQQVPSFAHHRAPLNAMINKAILTFLVPPPVDRTGKPVRCP